MKPVRQDPPPFSFCHVREDVTIVEPLSYFLRGICHEVDVPRPGKPVGVPSKLGSLAVEKEGNRFFGAFSNRSHTNSIQGTKHERFRLTEVDGCPVKPDIIGDRSQAACCSHDREESVVQREEKILRMPPKLLVYAAWKGKHETRSKLLQPKYSHPFAR